MSTRKDAATRHAITKAYAEVWARARLLYPLAGLPETAPPSRFDLKGLVAGAVVYTHCGRAGRGRYLEPQLKRFRWNVSHAKAVGMDEYRTTIAHEVAHAVRLMDAGDGTHGARWKAVCKALGGHGTATHRITAEIAEANPGLRRVKCGCDEPRYMGPRQYAKAKRTGARYMCRACGLEAVLV